MVKRWTLKQARVAKDMTQEQLGEACGMGQAQISQIESGIVEQPRLETMDRLAKALGMVAFFSVQGLFFEEPSDENS